jgi:hypothetical protein
MSDTVKTLADAMNALVASLGDHEVLKGVVGIDAIMDLEAYGQYPEYVRGIRDMTRSAEELIDDLRVRKISSDELAAAEKALEAYLRA